MWTALLTACFYDNYNCVKILINNGANYNIKNKHGSNWESLTFNDEIIKLINNKENEIFLKRTKLIKE